MRRNREVGIYLMQMVSLAIRLHMCATSWLTQLSVLVAVFRFTLFWTLVFYTPVFVLCGAYAFCNLNFPPSPRSYPPYNGTSDDASYELVQLPSPRPHSAHLRPSKVPKEKERRSRLAFALLVFVTFMVLGVAGAVVGSAVLGFAAFGLYRAANFNMST